MAVLSILVELSSVILFSDELTQPTVKIYSSLNVGIKTILGLLYSCC